MQVSVEKTSELGRKMTVSIPDAVWQEKMEARYKVLAKQVKVDGFRPGKVPVSMVKKIYGDRVKDEVGGDLIQSSYFDALEQQSLVPAGHPYIVPADKDAGFEYVAEFEVYPKISLEGVSSLNIKRPVSSVTDADVDYMVDRLKQQKKTWSVVERSSQQNDRVTIHFSGSCGGENFTDGKVENYQVEIGGNQMIPGFEDALTGLLAGETKTFSANFPEKYTNEKLAGKTAEFHVEMVKVEQPTLPELDADFIKAYGVDDGNLSTFMADVRVNMDRELSQGLKTALKNSVMDSLYENIRFTIPNVLVDQDINDLTKPYAERAKKLKLKLEDLNLPRDMFESQAKRRVALGLLMGEIIQKNEIKLDEDRVRSVVEEMAKSYEKPEDVINWYYGDKKRLIDVQQMVLEDQAVDWVLANATVTDEAVGFADIMEKR